VIGRRKLLGALGWLALCGVLPPARALTASYLAPPISGWLDGEQSDRFRAWLSFIVVEQIERGPSPRWFHRDCAGLARFAVAETLRTHDMRWQRANGFVGRRLPPELDLRPEQQRLLNGWTTLEGERQNFVTAQALIQKNRPIATTANASPSHSTYFRMRDFKSARIAATSGGTSI